jgi:hypothetical protein
MKYADISDFTELKKVLALIRNESKLILENEIVKTSGVNILILADLYCITKHNCNDDFNNYKTITKYLNGYNLID